MLGPKLFILYINDLCKVSTVLKLILSADDNSVFCSGDKLDKVIEELNISHFIYMRKKLHIHYIK